MLPQRYVIALLVAGLVILASGLFCWQTRRELRSILRECFLEAQRKGELPEELQGLDPDTVTGGFDIEVSSGQLWRIRTADTMTHYWFVLIPLLIGACFGCLWIVGRLRSP